MIIVVFIHRIYAYTHSHTHSHIHIHSHTHTLTHIHILHTDVDDDNISRRICILCNIRLESYAQSLREAIVAIVLQVKRYACK